MPNIQKTKSQKRQRNGQRYFPTHCENASKFSPEQGHFSVQLQNSYDYVTKRTRKSTKNKFLFSKRGQDRYLCVYPWALRFYHPSAQPLASPQAIHKCFRVVQLQCPWVDT